MSHVGHRGPDAAFQGYAGGVDAPGGQDYLRVLEVGGGKAEPFAAAVAVNHGPAEAVAAAQQYGGLAHVAPADEPAQGGGAHHRAVHNHRGELLHAEACFRAQVAQHVHMAAAVAAQGKIIAHHQTAQIHGQQIAAHKGGRVQGGQVAVERQLQHLRHAQLGQPVQAVLPGAQGHVPLVGKEHQPGVGPEGQHHRGKPVLPANFQRAADKGLMPQVQSIKIADGDARTGGRAERRHSMCDVHGSADSRSWPAQISRAKMKL